MDAQLLELFVHIIQQVHEEKLWDLWVNKEIDMEWEAFKKKSTKSTSNKLTAKELSDEEEEQIMKQAEDILNLEVNTHPDQ